MPNSSLFGPAPFLKKIPIGNAFAGVDPGLAAGIDRGPGAGTGVDPRTWQRGPQASSPWNWQDEEFRNALGEAWANNDLAAGYQSAMNPRAPKAQSFGSRTVQPAKQQQPAWVKPAAPSGYGDVLGHPIEGFRRRPGSIF